MNCSESALHIKSSRKCPIQPKKKQKMGSTYLDTELMLVIRSKEINKQLEEGMMEYEKVSRQALEDGTYHDPYHVKPIELTKKRQRNVFLVQHLLGWARYLF